MAETGTLTAVETLKVALGELDEEINQVDEEVHSLYAAWQDAEDRFNYLEEQREALASAIDVMTERSMA